MNFNNVRSKIFILCLLFLFVKGEALAETLQYQRYHSKEFTEYYYFDEPSVDTIMDNDGTIYGPNDERGIILTEWGGFKNLYHPTQIASVCISYFGGYIFTKDEVYKEIVLRHADWLAENQVIIDEKFGIWQFNFPNLAFGANVPWISAMTQGRAISGLLRAYQLDNNPIYINAAKLAIKAFDYSIKDGGCKYVDEDGFIWYEEVAVLPPAHILNGFIFALFGLYDYYRAMEDPHALELFETGVKTLRKKLYLYDTCWITRYDLLLRSQLFHLITSNRQPESKHPIDKIILIVDDVETTLDIGTIGDNDKSNLIDGTFLWDDKDQSPMDWGPSYVLDGRSVRDYFNNDEAKYQHGAFRMKLPKVISLPSEDIQLEIQVHYKDVTHENMYLEIYDGQKYHQIGVIEGKGNGKWKIDKFIFPSTWLHFGGRLSQGYHNLVVKQLKGLYNIIDDEFFLNTSEKWESQVK